MIQFNLLPDVKLEYIKARKTKHAVLVMSTLVGSVAFTIFVLLFVVVNFAQKNHLSNVESDIASSKKELQSKEDLAKILTIQNQLNSLPGLHDQKPVATRVLGYVQQLTPKNISISSLDVNFADQTIQIEGSAESLATINTFVDTLKFTNYVTTDGQDSTKTSDPTEAFSEVVLASFGVNGSNQGDKNKSASYTITFKYDPIIFQGDQNVSLQVTSKVTTRSETEKPSAFQSKPTQEAN